MSTGKFEQSIRRARVGVAGAGVALLVVLGGSTAMIVRGEDSARDALASRFSARQATAAHFIEAYVNEVFQGEKTLATRSLAGTVTGERFVDLATDLGYPAAVLLDAQGRLLAAQPAPAPEALGRDLGAKYAHLGSALAGTPAVSGVVPSAVVGAPVVGFAVPFDTPQGRRVFSGAYAVGDTPMALFVRDATPFRFSNVLIVDANGVIVASNQATAAGRPVTEANPAWATLNITSGYQGSGAKRQYFTQSIVPGTTWRLIFTVGTDELFAPMDNAGRWIPWLLLAGFGVAATLALVLLYSYLTRRARLVESEARSRTIADTEKDQFLSHVSHELRSPLSVVNLFAQLLLGGSGGPLLDEQRELLTVLKRNAGQLKVMLDDLLQVTRGETGRLRMNCRALALGELLDEAVAAYQPTVHDRRITLSVTFPILPTVLGDAERLHEVLTNLIGNALKFTPDGGRISIEAIKDGDNVCVTVRDTGSGLRPGDEERIFTKFFQANQNSDESRNGFGLGLYICKQLIELQGGTIWAASGPETGTAMSFTIPILTVRNNATLQS